MPNRNDIQNEILKSTAQDIVRRQYLKKLSEYTNRDTIIYATAFTFPKSNILNTTLTDADINGFMSSLHGLTGKELDLILHSPGGSADAAEQIVKYLK